MLKEEDKDDLDDVPPLEDMSHIINKLKVASQEQTRPIQSATPKTAPAAKALDREDNGKKKTGQEFSGLQKGFFSAKPKPKTTAKPPSIAAKPACDDIPFIKASLEKQKNPLELSEIREAMASQFEKTRNDWMTPAFMEKIEKSPVLCRAFQDDRFLAISQQLAADPIATIQRVSKEMPHFIPALQEFTALIGEAMEQKALDEERKKQPPLDSFEQGLIDRVMGDTDVQTALKDPQIQKLLLQLRSDPSQSIGRIMQTSSPDIRAKIQVLIGCGLLSVVQ